MSRLLPWLLAGLGGALVVAGAAVVLGSAADPVTVYTGGYAPLEAAGPAAYRSELSLTFDGAVRSSVGQLVGAGIVVLGLLVLTGLAGWLAGVRSARRRAG
jgi:hypothetical protein